ncbi:hypothetical protein GCM10009105_10560 [Dokdonella soli]|uniref:Uncharacterized protein n=2 Tax=Dokdonella soli TaxID=529810 RepID=A0ABN1IE29_9GAMM
MELLGIKDGPRRTTMLTDLTRQLDVWASELANAKNVLLRSDFISLAAPLAKRAGTFSNVLQRADGHLTLLMEYQRFVNFEVLHCQLQGFQDFLGWLQQESSKKGGERSSYRKQCNARWKDALTSWFDARHKPSSGQATEQQRRRFLLIIQRVVERAVKTFSQIPANTGKK